MKAVDFIRKFGWDSAINIINGWGNKDFDDSYNIKDDVYCNLPFEPTDDCGTLCLFELNKYVSAYQLIHKDFESVEMADYEHMVSGCYSDPYWIELRKAITLVEEVGVLGECDE